MCMHLENCKSFHFIAQQRDFHLLKSFSVLFPILKLTSVLKYFSSRIFKGIFVNVSLWLFCMKL